MPAVSVAGPGRGIGQRVRFGIELALSRPHPDSQIDQITSASDANRVIGKFRDRQQPGERKRSCGSPDQAAGTAAACSKASFTTAFDCRGSQYQSGVEARRDGKQAGRSGKRKHRGDIEHLSTVSDRVASVRGGADFRNQRVDLPHYLAAGRNVDAALLLGILLPPPAASALILAIEGRAGAWTAANARETFGVERMDWNAVPQDVVIHILPGPIRQRADLHCAIAALDL